MVLEIKDLVIYLTGGWALTAAIKLVVQSWIDSK